MIVREHYIRQIRPFYHSDLVKIITGIRRCGKSVLLKQICEELRKEGEACLFLDFDLKPTRNMISDADALIEYVAHQRGQGKYVVFLYCDC